MRRITFYSTGAHICLIFLSEVVHACQKRQEVLAPSYRMPATTSLHQFTPPHVWRHLPIFQISHFGANDAPRRKQFLQYGNSQISITARCLCRRLTEEASLIGRLHLKSFHNYTIILKMHVCMLLSLHQFTALSAQLRLAFLSVDANSPHLAPNEA